MQPAGIHTMDTENIVLSVVCIKCGARMPCDMERCPACGKRQKRPAEKGRSPRKEIGIVVAAVAAILLLLLVFTAVKKGKAAAVEMLALDRSFLALEIENGQQLDYTVTPAEAEKILPEWTSSDTSIATVDAAGYVEAKAEGNCVITLTVGDVSAQCRVTVSASGVDLVGLYDRWCQAYFADVASDGSYLTLDTNPYDIEEHLDYAAYFAISDVNDALGLPDSLLRKMDNTRALDGRMTEYYDHITVSWTYHPDDGLEILYELP